MALPEGGVRTMDAQAELRSRARSVTASELVARRAELDAYVARVREVAAVRDFIDVRTLVRLVDRLNELLDRVGDLDADGRALLGAAVDYLLDESDREADLVSPLGFDDDREVVDAACRLLVGGSVGRGR